MNRIVKMILPVAVLTMALGVALVAQESKPKSDRPDQAILDAYAKSINDRDHATIAATWADDAEHIADDGTVTTGREAIAAMFKKTLADHPKLTVSLTPASTKQLGNEVLVIDGVAQITNGENSESSRFESIWVKSGGRWQISRVREFASIADNEASNYVKLKGLEWLIGEWTATSGKHSLSVTAKWGKNRNFLIVDQSVKVGAEEVITVYKVIGWDPVNDSLRSWVFDSEGGFGGALISRADNTWTEASEAVSRDGNESAAAHTTTFINANSFVWTSTERRLDGHPQPDLKITYTRVK
jgi:uncharacterized protein (TIGR02246 family)